MKNFTGYLLSLSLCLTLLGGFSFQAIAAPSSLEMSQPEAQEVGKKIEVNSEVNEFDSQPTKEVDSDVHESDSQPKENDEVSKENEVKKYLESLSSAAPTVLAIFSGLGFIISLVFSILAYNLSNNSLETSKNSLNISNESFSLAQNNAKNQKTERTLELFQAFRSERMRNARTIAWKAIPKWFDKQGKYRKYQMECLFSITKLGKTRLGEVRTPNCKTEEEIQADNERNAIFDILEFYSVVAYHPADNEILKKYTSYYYPWWRGFIKSFFVEYNRFQEAINREQQKQLPNIPWEESINHLEQRLKLPKYNHKNDFLYCDFDENLFE